MIASWTLINLLAWSPSRPLAGMPVVVNDRKRYLDFFLLPMSIPCNNGDFGRIPGIDRLLEKEDTSTHLQTWNVASV